MNTFNYLCDRLIIQLESLNKITDECYDLGINELPQYDLIILDLYLSEINGFELINLIRNHKKEQVNKVKIIPMSAGVKETDKKIILENNIPSLLNKPFTAEDLYSEIYKNI